MDYRLLPSSFSSSTSHPTLIADISDNNSDHGSSSSSSGDNSIGCKDIIRIIPGPEQHARESSGSDDSPQSYKKQKHKGSPYIPSYMDLTNGPEPCVVCGDAATGYHYRCMTCEGCKGFFRRSVQKNLSYHCKWNNVCVIDKNTRNQCQQCRFKKCTLVGMATDLVLNEKQRTAKRKLIDDNREKRRSDCISRTRGPGDDVTVNYVPEEHVTESDEKMIRGIGDAYRESAIHMRPGMPISPSAGSADLVHLTPLMRGKCDPTMGMQMAQLMTPSVIKVVEFAKRVPGFSQFRIDDQISLLKSCCIEIMCLRIACRYDADSLSLTLYNGHRITQNNYNEIDLGSLVKPIYEFAMSLHRLNLDDTELALLAAVLLVQSERPDLVERNTVEHLQDKILGAFKRYVAQARPSQPVHWAKILMKITDLRAISSRHAEQLLGVKLDGVDQQVPPMFVQMFSDTPPAPANGH